MQLKFQLKQQLRECALFERETHSTILCLPPPPGYGTTCNCHENTICNLPFSGLREVEMSVEQWTATDSCNGWIKRYDIAHVMIWVM